MSELNPINNPALNNSALNNSALKGVRVLDLSRILAGPSASQLLGDMGADVVKVEKPAMGDDTRKWGPPFLKDQDGNDTMESSYYLSANRNKRSIEIDFTTDEGRDIVLELMQKADIVLENYKVGTLKKYGLAYDDVKKDMPSLIYCSLTGFGQTGPYKDKAGYDFLVQAMGGIMSLTGTDDIPCKTGVAIADLMAGMYLVNAALSALYYREKTGKGQYIDISLLDTQVAWLSNAAQYYLTSNELTPRMGNAHPTIVPYEVFKTSDGYVVLAIGNDKQFKDFCDFAGIKNDFSTNKERVENRNILIPIIKKVMSKNSSHYWTESLKRYGVPCGLVNNLQQVFADPQVLAREMVIKMDHSLTNDKIKMLGCPIKMSETPPSYRREPPTLGQHTEEILQEWLEK